MESDFTCTVEPELPDDDIRLLAPGTMVSQRFEIDRPLGRGGYAVVYAAYDHELKQRIAIKVLRSDRVTPSSLKRMRREVSVAREVASPRLVRLYDVGEHENTTYLTMELVDGVSLREELANGLPAIDEALRVSDSILEALEALHAHGLIHRDLKPANIIVTRNGEVKLADFGLTRHWENEEMPATRTAAVVGTLEYVSPEQALGRDLDPRSDLYSFGVLLYELLTGQLPFGAASSLGAVVAHVTTTLPDVRKVRADVPAWLAELIRNLLEKEPNKRPANAGTVRAALRSSKIDWGYRWRRARMSLVTTVGVIVLAAVSATLAWNQYQSRFDRLVHDSSGVTHAFDRRGRVLWSRDDVQAGIRAAAVTVQKGEVRVYGIPDGPLGTWDADRESARPFFVYDAQTGTQVDSVAVPPPPPVFNLPPSFNLGGVHAVDIDHDGLDEIIANYVHIPYWPSYTLFVDPRTKQSAILLYASGHHRFLGSVDLDYDGRDEILIGGPNNRMGWRYGVAAVRVRRGNESVGGTWVAVSTPDSRHYDLGGDPLWYALLPRRASYAARLDAVDPSARTIDLLFDDGKRERLTFDGFSVGVTTQLSATKRQQRRETAYQFLREAKVEESRGLIESSLAKAVSARDAAHDAGEPELESWMETAYARMLVRTGRNAEQVRMAVEVMLDEGDGGSELCAEVANVYSERGEPREALYWYARALGLATDLGHTPVDYLRSAVVSAGEIGEWDRASELINTFIETTPGMSRDAALIRAFVLWRTGGPPDPNLTSDASPMKFGNYANLELQWANGVDDTERFLELVRSALSITEEAPWMRSLEADVLASLGRTDEALPIARMAMDEVMKDPADAVARVHRGIVAERLHRIEKSEGELAGP